MRMLAHLLGGLIDLSTGVGGVAGAAFGGMPLRALTPA
jgi:hypothetical protein